MYLVYQLNILTIVAACLIIDTQKCVEQGGGWSDVLSIPPGLNSLIIINEEKSFSMRSIYMGGGGRE